MLAETLGKPVYELRAEMPSEELFGWQTHFAMKEEERKQAQKEAERGGKRRR